MRLWLLRIRRVSMIAKDMGGPTLKTRRLFFVIRSISPVDMDQMCLHAMNLLRKGVTSLRYVCGVCLCLSVCVCVLLIAARGDGYRRAAIAHRSLPSFRHCRYASANAHRCHNKLLMRPLDSETVLLARRSTASSSYSDRPLTPLWDSYRHWCNHAGFCLCCLCCV